jgi:hypothetical protein
MSSLRRVGRPRRRNAHLEIGACLGLLLKGRKGVTRNAIVIGGTADQFSGATLLRRGSPGTHARSGTGDKPNARRFGDQQAGASAALLGHCPIEPAPRTIALVGLAAAQIAEGPRHLPTARTWSARAGMPRTRHQNGDARYTARLARTKHACERPNRWFEP